MTFRCRHYRCKMTSEACVRRQAGRIKARSYNSSWKPIDPFCANGDCKQGNKHRERHPEISGEDVIAGSRRRKR